MKCWSTKSGQKIFQILSGRCNSFLISSGDKYILIDTGRENKWNNLKRRLVEIQLKENSLSALILTHTHFDHAENAYRIKEVYKTNLIVHKSEADFISSGNNPVINGTNPITKFITYMIGTWILQFVKYKPVDYDITVEDKYDLSTFGFNAYIISTPGHSSGSISVIIDNEIAIVGDAMFGVFKNSVFPPYAEQPEVMIRSWKKLLDTGCSVFIPAHGTANSRELLQKEYEKYKNKYGL